MLVLRMKLSMPRISFVFLAIVLLALLKEDDKRCFIPFSSTCHATALLRNQLAK